MEQPDGRKTLHGVASSTTTDLHGDTMEQSALEDMERDANAGLTIFGNHSYQVPEDVYGLVTRAKLGTRGADQDGNPNYDLDFDIEVNEDNPRALAAWKAVKKGHKIGLSIGAMIPAGGAVRDKKSGAYRIQHVKLLETSVVGIPANPRSWIQNSVGCTCSGGTTDPKCKRGLDGLTADLSLDVEKATHQLGAPTITIQDGLYHIKGSLGDLTLDKGWGEPDTDATICGAESLDGGIACSNEPHHDGGHSWDMTSQEPQGVGKALDLEEGAKPCPDCGKTDCDHRKDADPDLEKAKIQVITIDTGDDGSSSDGSSSSQDAPPSEPGGDEEFAAPAPDVVASAEDLLESSQGEVALTSLQGVLDLLRTVTTELVDTRQELAKALEANKALERERDQALDETAELIARTAQLLEQVGNLPVGRKAFLKEATTEVAQLASRLDGGPYSPQFLKMLNSGGTPT